MPSQTKLYNNTAKNSAQNKADNKTKDDKADGWVPQSQPDESGQQSVIRTLAYLWPYIWPQDRRDLQRRVFVAALFLVFAKLITAATPFFFKYAPHAGQHAQTGHRAIG